MRTGSRQLLQHRRFTDELVSLEEKAEVRDQLDIPWLRQPIDPQLKALSEELREQWLALERELRQGKLKHFDYDSKTGALTWRRPKADNDAAHQDGFYEQLAFCDVADVVRFTNEQCQSLSALTPLQLQRDVQRSQNRLERPVQSTGRASTACPFSSTFSAVRAATVSPRIESTSSKGMAQCHAGRSHPFGMETPTTCQPS